MTNFINNKDKLLETTELTDEELTIVDSFIRIALPEYAEWELEQEFYELISQDGLPEQEIRATENFIYNRVGYTYEEGIYL